MTTNPFQVSEEPESSPRNRKRSGGSGKVSAGKYEIDPSHTLNNFEHNFAEAYECSNSDAGTNDFAAIVLKDRYPVRKLIVDKCLANSDIEGLMSLVTTQVVEWVDGTQRYALIYKRPDGAPIMTSTAQRREPLSEDMIRRGIIRPIAQIMQKFSTLGLFHGNIRPTNLFLTNYESAQAILGECASSAPGILQPTIFETIERGMANHEGRGVGTEVDDIYSFGATIAVLMRGFNPMEGKSDRTIIEEKIQRGSYAVLTDGLRLSPGVSEFLRATLNDDPRQRWDIDQLVAWSEGNRTTPKPAATGQKAQRHLEFNGKKYSRPRLLAKDLHENPAEAVTLIEGGNLVKWVERALGDQSMVSALNVAIGRASTNGRTPGFEERLLCFVSMALDPIAPIRYKNVRVLPSGIGHYLALAMLKNENIQVFGELIRDRYAWNWLNLKENIMEDSSERIHAFDNASKMIIRRGINYGLERCLYELCPDVPCLSDYFKNFYVTDCYVLLKALNDVAKNNKEDKVIDRHIASFITTRDSRDNAGLIMIVEGDDGMRRSLALLTIYQQLQRRHNLQKLVGLAEWLSKEAETVAQRFRNIEDKNAVLKQLPKEVASGNLSRVLSLIDNPAMVRKDEYNYMRAVQAFSNYGREREMIRHQLINNPRYGFSTGRQIALLISMAIAAVIIACILVNRFAGGV